MRKEVIYSLRMSKQVRDSLYRIAREEQRTVASLLDKIIQDYLAQRGGFTAAQGAADQRWFTRREVFRPAQLLLTVDEEKREHTIVILDISLGGVLIGFPKSEDLQLKPGNGSQFDLYLQMPEQTQPLCVACKTHRVEDSGHALRVGASFMKTNADALQSLKGYLN